MVIYAHRGNLDGPKSDKENSPDYVDQAIEAGYAVEVDLRSTRGTLFLGHDFPTYQITPEWLAERANSLLIHIKDLASLRFVTEHDNDWHHFCHSNDPFTITSRNRIWLHDLSRSPNMNTIVPLITEALVAACAKQHINEFFGVCSDYPILCSKTLK